MTRAGRLGAVILFVLGALAIAPAIYATHCEGQPHPPAVPDDYPCYTDEPPTPRPTPRPTAKPTAKPTAAPTRAPVRRTTTGSQPAVATVAPETSPFPVELDETTPSATPQILVEGPGSGSDTPLDVAKPAASASSWIFGFIVGLIIGGLVGRASWGLRKRGRSRQIFG